jgi:ABC-type amino acid transport substrate-binding protein
MVPGKPVATVGGSLSQNGLNKKGAKVQSFASIEEGVAALKNGSVQPVVCDAPILKYFEKNRVTTSFL